MSTQVETFVTNLQQSHLLDDSMPPWVDGEIKALAAMTADAEAAWRAQQFAAKLVDGGQLTAWQARMLLGGRKAFFRGRYRPDATGPHDSHRSGRRLAPGDCIYPTAGTWWSATATAHCTFSGCNRGPRTERSRLSDTRTTRFGPVGGWR